MCDFFEADFIFEDSLEDRLEDEMDEPFTDDTELDDEPIEAESQDDNLTVDPFFIVGVMGFAYEEGLRERKRLIKFIFPNSAIFDINIDLIFGASIKDESIAILPIYPYRIAVIGRLKRLRIYRKY